MDKVLCIDPGHGGYDPGSIGPNGVKEKSIALSVSLKIGEYLKRAGVYVVYTRNSDIVSWPSDLIKDLSARCIIANDSKADIFVSIHCNSSTTIYSNEILTTPGHNTADDVASCIYSRFKAAFPNLSFREDWSDGDADLESNSYVIRHTNMPAVFCELGRINDSDEEKMLVSIEFQEQAALAIAQGIGDYFGITIP